MGWLFAVALGMQEQKGSAVARALVPIAVGHALSIGIVVVSAAFLGMAMPQEAIRYSVAALLSVLESSPWRGITIRAGSACGWASAT
jgi:hypothetical protein